MCSFGCIVIHCFGAYLDVGVNFKSYEKVFFFHREFRRIIVAYQVMRRRFLETITTVLFFNSSICYIISMQSILKLFKDLD